MDGDGTPVPRADDDRVFEVWKESERVAVHFNDLLMRWRLQCMGGLGTLITICGFVLKDMSDAEMRYRAMFLFASVLLLGWIGVAVVDLAYYRRLLSGAVKAIIECEKKLGSEVMLSQRIEEDAARGAAWAPWAFYGLGALALVVVAYYAHSRLP